MHGISSNFKIFQNQFQNHIIKYLPFLEPSPNPFSVPPLSLIRGYFFSPVVCILFSPL